MECESRSPSRIRCAQLTTRLPSESFSVLESRASVSSTASQEEKYLLTLCIIAANIQLKRKLGFTDVLC